ncbi:hypothetical protein VTP01DRAFT_6513 [Rhizomucor pusillus]|uniref:uncharacterized protein n=1 Tax=Rhizomucor pusillus TaxID=4840 RepID=UPI00374452DF
MHSRTAYLLGIILGAIVFFSTCSTVLRARLLALKTAAQSLVNRSSPVPIELLVMSKCPDKVYCEQVFGQVLDKVNVPTKLDVNYIAEPDLTEPLLFECKHGPSECLGDIQELCFKHVHPDQRDWFAFDLCLNEHYEDIGNDKQLAHDCASRLGKDYAKVELCIKSKLGVGLLAKSVERTKSLGVTKSCTIYIDNQLRCIRDGTWKECEGGHQVDDFVKTIEDAYHSRNVCEQDRIAIQV